MKSLNNISSNSSIIMKTIPSSPIPPHIDLTIDGVLQQGSHEWRLTSQRVREALETYGCILVKPNKMMISDEDRQKLFEAMRSLFDLPVDVKRKNSLLKDALSTYPGEIPHVPLYEALGLMNAVEIEKVKEFTLLMWPHGNDELCNTLNSMSNSMWGLSWIIMDMIMDGYGLPEEYRESLKKSTDALFHMKKYTAPKMEEPAVALVPHTDVNYLTVLCQNEVSGLRIMTKEGEWFSADLGQDHFIVFVGQSLRAWSNGRLHPPLHQVTFGGVKDRLTCASFLMPKPAEIVQAPPQMVDDRHPPLIKPYVYEEFFKYIQKFGATEDVLDKFAAII